MFSKTVKAVAARDLRSWFSNPAGYVFILIFVVGAAALMVTSADFFRANLANLDTLNRVFPLLLCLFVPAITMSTWSVERANGTMELLFTLPAKDSEILLGKMVAAAVVYSVSLLFMLALPLGLEMLGDPDWGQMLANFVGYWLYGVMLISLSMIGSQLSSNLTVAFILGALFAVLGAFSDFLIGLVFPALGASWAVDGPSGQFGQFARGLVPVSGIVLFLGLAVAFFYLNLSLLARRHWRQGDATAVHSGARFAAMALCCVGGTGFLVHTTTPLDLTAERLHSLSPETVKLISGIDPARPAYITVFVSERVPTALEQQKRNLLNMVDRFDSVGGAGVEKRIVITEPYTEEAAEAKENYGIEAMIGADDGSGSFSDGVFLGFVVQCGLEEVVVPFLEPGLSAEYELARSVRVASGAARKTVGVLKTDVELYGGIDFQTFRQKPRWKIVDELQLQYKVENVDPDSDYSEKLDALVVPQPSSLSQEQMDRLQRWIAAGHPTLLLEDTYPMSAPGTAAADPKGGDAARFNPQAGGEKGDFGRLLSAFGLSMPIHEVVWDQSFRLFRMMGDDLPPEFLFVDRGGMDQGDPVTSGLGRVVLMLSGHVRFNDKPGFSARTLLRSVPGPDTPNGTIQRDRIFVWNPFGASSQWDPNRPWRLNPRDYALAVRVTGKPQEGAASSDAKDSDKKDGEAAKKPVDLIVVGDLDAFSNTFFQLRSMNADNDNLRFDNVTFVLNCIDSLAGDDSLIELRKRRPKLRSLTAVTAAQEQFENEWIKERDEANGQAEKELADAQKRLDDAVKAIENDTEMDANAKELRIAEARENEQRNLDVRKREIEDEKRARIGLAKRRKEIQKRSVQFGFQVRTLLLAFLPPLILGLVTFFRRRARESRNVPTARLVGGGDR
ncbi:MAG: Gldg family protein [Planctomycetota bacterium]